MKKLLILVLCFVLCICFAACTNTKTTAGDKTDENVPKEKDDTLIDTPLIVYDEGETVMVTITMEDGRQMKFKLYPDKAPITVANFVTLAKEGFYDNLTFHRIIEGFMIQGGDPLGTGMGGSDKNIVGEFAANGINNDLKHIRGAISMARAKDYNSASSQFFIMHEDADYLDGQYAAFGMMTEGYDVLDELAVTPVNGDTPVTKPVIKTITVEE